MTQKRICIVDDEEPIRKLLENRLKREGYSVQTAAGGNEAIENWGDPGVLVTDLKMPGRDGLSLMDWVRERREKSGVPTQVILITGHGEKEVAVSALRSGVFEYLEKPFDLEVFSQACAAAQLKFDRELRKLDEKERAEARAERAEKARDVQDVPVWVPSTSESMRDARRWVETLARESKPQVKDPSVLILGPSGSGKEGFARKIHTDSKRSRGPWIAVNCANFSEALLESELFGHEKGAFTGAAQTKRGLFELASGGTLFLDEIGEMPDALQARLLRTLQEGTLRRVGGSAEIEVDVRIIAATQPRARDRLREDLFHRISGVVIELAPLARRLEEIVPLAEAFCERAMRIRSKPWKGLHSELKAALCAYPWPGNVRELQNACERASLVHTGSGELSVSDFGLLLPSATPAPAVVVELHSGLVDPLTLKYSEAKKQAERDFELKYLVQILRKHHGNVSAAAREAQLDRSNLLRLLRKHGLKSEAFKRGEVWIGAGRKAA